MEEEKKSVLETTCKKVEKIIDSINEQGIQPGNIEYLYKLVDVHKDIKNEEYWKKKEEETMRYRDGYGDNYGRQGRYNAGGNYGRRGIDSKYEGEEALNEMYQAYGEYSEGKENYGNDNMTMESFEYMLKALKDFTKHLKKEANSAEEKQMLQKTVREMSMM